MQVPVGHGERRERFDDADNTVGLEYELPIHQPVLLGITGFAEENVRFGNFVGEDRGGCTVSETAGEDELAAHVRVYCL